VPPSVRRRASQACGAGLKGTQLVRPTRRTSALGLDTLIKNPIPDAQRTACR